MVNVLYTGDKPMRAFGVEIQPDEVRPYNADEAALLVRNNPQWFEIVGNVERASAPKAKPKRIAARKAGGKREGRQKP